MKTTLKLIIVAMTAVSVFASCQKEMAIETANNTNDAVRVISAQFDNSTKATLDGLKPSFENNDEIRVSNSEKSEVCKVSVSGSTVSFTTTLSGALTAIYPAAAAVLSSGEADAPIATSNNIKVLSSQTGSVKDAIIVKATVAAGENTATFQGQTAVFRITPGAAASTKYVEVITAGPEIANTTTTEYTKKNKIHVATNTASEVFVSVLVPTGLKLRDLSFADGSNIKTVIDATKGATAIAANTIYTITSSGWNEPYVEINGLKWATRNIGANTSTDAGYYFFWGGTVGYVRSGSDWVMASNTSSVLSGGFCHNNDPHYSGSAYTKYTETDKKTVLDLADDAANANWGGSWRMPTNVEFDNLNALKQGDFASGYHFGGSSASEQIFLPVAGIGFETNLFLESEEGDYWSSSLFTATPSSAYYLYFDTDGPLTSDYDRYSGMSVRALSD